MASFTVAVPAPVAAQTPNVSAVVQLGSTLGQTANTTQVASAPAVANVVVNAPPVADGPGIQHTLFRDLPLQQRRSLVQSPRRRIQVQIRVPNNGLECANDTAYPVKMLKSISRRARMVTRGQTYMVITGVTRYAVEQLLNWAYATCRTGAADYAPFDMSVYNPTQLLQILQAVRTMGIAHQTLKFTDGCLALAPNQYMHVWHAAIVARQHAIAASLEHHLDAYFTSSSQSQRQELLLLAEQLQMYNVRNTLHPLFWSAARAPQDILNDLEYLFGQPAAVAFKARIVRDAVRALRQQHVQIHTLPFTNTPALLAQMRLHYPQTPTSAAGTWPAAPLTLIHSNTRGRGRFEGMNIRRYAA